mmetsp:Transcript_11742/g.41116  ORF Transcript_11742/g.41116 Transcript_11742/m.41116 type:complete len:233 (+) Transcript_11742:640-1338(+)
MIAGRPRASRVRALTASAATPVGRPRSSSTTASRRRSATARCNAVRPAASVARKSHSGRRASALMHFVWSRCTARCSGVMPHSVLDVNVRGTGRLTASAAVGSGTRSTSSSSLLGADASRSASSALASAAPPSPPSYPAGPSAYLAMECCRRTQRTMHSIAFGWAPRTAQCTAVRPMSSRHSTPNNARATCPARGNESKPTPPRSDAPRTKRSAASRPRSPRSARTMCMWPM